MTKLVAVLAFASMLLVTALSSANAALVGPGHLITGGGAHSIVSLQPAGDDNGGSH